MESFRLRVAARGLEMARSCRYMRAVMTQQFKIRLPDGSVREVAPGTTPADVAAAIGPGLAKAAMAARVNGEVRDLNRPLEGDSERQPRPRITAGQGATDAAHAEGKLASQ